MKNFLRIWSPLFALSCLTFSFLACTPPTTGPTCNGNEDCIRGEICRDGICRLSNPGCQSSQDCPSGQVCDAGTCRTSNPTCQNSCQPNARQCIDAAFFQLCQAGTDGCLAWGGSQACASGESCANGVCQKQQAGEGQTCVTANDCSSGLVCAGKQQTGFFCRRRCGKSADCAIKQYCYDLQGGGAACLDGTNGAPRDFKYQIEVISAKVTERDGRGQEWDAFGGLPDLYVYIEIGGSKLQTSYVTDRTTADWSFTSNSRYTASEIESMRVSLYDSDNISDDLIASWTSFSVEQAGGTTWVLKNENEGVISLEIRVVGIAE